MGVPKVPKALAAEWAAKLAASGFVDAETTKGDLKEPASRLRHHIRRPLSAGVEDYFRMAGQWLHVNIWRSRYVRRLWELHTEGYLGTEIQALFGPGKGRHHVYSHDYLREEQRRMHGSYALDPGDEAPPESLHAEELSTFPVFDRVVATTGYARRGRGAPWGEE